MLIGPAVHDLMRVCRDSVEEAGLTDAEKTLIFSDHLYLCKALPPSTHSSEPDHPSDIVADDNTESAEHRTVRVPPPDPTSNSDSRTWQVSANEVFLQG